MTKQNKIKKVCSPKNCWWAFQKAHLQTTGEKVALRNLPGSFQVNIKLERTAPFIYRLSNLHVMYFSHTSMSLSTLKANTDLTEQNYLPIIATHKSRPISPWNVGNSLDAAHQRMLSFSSVPDLSTDRPAQKKSSSVHIFETITNSMLSSGHSFTS